MTKSDKNVETKQDKKLQKKQQTYVQTEQQAGSSFLSTSLPEQMIFSDGLKKQVDLLNNPNIPVIQRQAVASQIIRIQGNAHFQRVLSASKQSSMDANDSLSNQNKKNSMPGTQAHSQPEGEEKLQRKADTHLVQRTIEMRDVGRGQQSGFARLPDIFRELEPAEQQVPQECKSNVGFLLRSTGIGPGGTALRPGATITFHNLDTRPHQIRISPANLVDNDSFTVPAGGRVDITVTTNLSGQSAGGSIIDSPGPDQTVHDIEVCPGIPVQ